MGATGRGDGRPTVDASWVDRGVVEGVRPRSPGDLRRATSGRAGRRPAGDGPPGDHHYTDELAHARVRAGRGRRRSDGATCADPFHARPRTAGTALPAGGRRDAVRL